ncbi:MAG: HK97 gp10 family phage protein [Gammaproteobacteria bacterium]|jgi:hypothetical protein|nr:HK97 gp10 family phage protein [Gammaproteobacteria bacterium]
MSFEGGLSRFNRTIERRVERKTRATALQVFSGLILRTPVDTGRARANWNTSAGAIDYSIDEDATKPQSPTLRKGDGSKPIYITNNLPYIGELENGSSTQAPKGMVAVTLSELKGGMR